MLVLKFLIDDNPYLDPEYVKQLKAEYTGVFYNRFILGQWVIAEGLVYGFFDPDKHCVDDVPEDGRWYVSMDYGTQNACTMGLWCVRDRQAVRVAEYYHSGRDSKRQLTDEEYYEALERLVGDRYIEYVVIDPSAASFIATIKRHGRFMVRRAVNDVLDGIRVTASMLNNGMIKIHKSCTNTIREFGLYAWDEKAKDDKPIKENDHCMDDCRYMCNTILRREFRWDDWRPGNVADGEN